MDAQAESTPSALVDELTAVVAALGLSPADIAKHSEFEAEWQKLINNAAFADQLSQVKLSSDVTAKQLQDQLSTLSVVPFTPEEDSFLNEFLAVVPTNLKDANSVFGALELPGGRKRSVLEKWFRAAVVVVPAKPLLATPAPATPKNEKASPSRASRPADALPYNERVSYEVSPGVVESCTVVISGPNKGKYQDDSNPALIFDNNQDWIRSKNAGIPQNAGAS